MSKIVCDVCGTAYPETATQCPICGSAKADSEQSAAGQAPAAEDTAYSYVKGGRFSKRNVRRRAQTGGRTGENRTTAVRKSDSEVDGEGTNIGLIVVVIVLLLAIIAVVIYIGVRFFAAAPDNGPAVGGTTDSTGVSQTQEATDDLSVPCTALALSNKTIEFRLSGDAWLLEAEATPANTTDKITFASSNEKVAIVSDAGRVTAVGGGEAVITVTCGTVTQECKIICSFSGIVDPSQDATQDATTGEIDPDFTFEFNTKFVDETTGKYDTTIDAPGKTWRAYKKNMTVKPEDVTWTSDDPSIATIDKGIVTAVAPGRTEVHAQYGGQTYTCIVRCSWKVENTDTETDEETDDTAESAFAFNTAFKDGEKWDITLAAGKTWRAYKKDSGVTPENVVWTVDDTGVCTIENGVVTTVAKGRTELHAEYEGKTYTCIIRVTG